MDNLLATPETTGHPNIKGTTIQGTKPLRGALDRRGLGRALSNVGDATVSEALKGLVQSSQQPGHRIGITGSPGAGKSTLVNCLAQERVARADINLGVLAVDPTSPISQGSILGDRVRFSDAGLHERIFFRSMPSRRAYDGLTDNIADLLLTMERFGLDETILETVGVGQINYAVRALVDTVVLVLVPGNGDEVQAMKAGIMEIADVFIVNKCDLPGADKLYSDLVATLKMRSYEPEDWKPPVLMASAQNRQLDGISNALDAHRAWNAARPDRDQRDRIRTSYHVASLLNRRIEEVLSGMSGDLFKLDLASLYERVRSEL